MTLLMMTMGFVFGYLEMTGHVGLANALALVMIVVGTYDYVKKLPNDRKAVKSSEHCNH